MDGSFRKMATIGRHIYLKHRGVHKMQQDESHTGHHDLWQPRSYIHILVVQKRLVHSLLRWHDVTSSLFHAT